MLPTKKAISSKIFFNRKKQKNFDIKKEKDHFFYGINRFIPIFLPVFRNAAGRLMWSMIYEKKEIAAGRSCCLYVSCRCPDCLDYIL